MTTLRPTPTRCLLALAAGLLLGCAGPAPQPRVPAPAPVACPQEEAPPRALEVPAATRAESVTLTGGFRGIATTVRPTIRRN